MTQQDEPPPAHSSDSASDAIDRLLRLAGSRPAGDAERMVRVREAVHDAWRDSVRRRSQRRQRTIGAMVLAAACVAFAVRLARRAESPAPTPAAIAARLTSATGTIDTFDDTRVPVRAGYEATVGSAFETGTAVLATFAFSDGGEVRMNEGTVVRFTGARELHVERGVIYLDSGPRSGSLVVHTAVGVVRDVGTRFEVGLVGGAWRIRVRDGLVRFDRDAARHQAGAGRELIVQPSGSVIERPSATYGADWGWVGRAAPAFPVEGQTLAAFLDWVARESGRRVEFASDELRRTVSGTILHGSIGQLSAEEALDVILPTCGLSHRIESERVIVLRPGTPAGSPR